MMLGMIAQRTVHPSLPSGIPLLFKKATGAFLYDSMDNQYLDFMNGKGSLILGHNHPSITEKIIDFFETNRKITTGFSEEIFELSSLICSALDHQEVSYFKTGTEAVKAAVNASMAYSGKKIILSAGYHGYDKMWQFSGEVGIPNQEGVVDFFFDLRLLEKYIQDYKGQVSTVIISPDPLYLNEEWFSRFKSIIEGSNIILISDEVKVGFRYSFEHFIKRFGLKPHISIVSKAISNGFPLSIVSGASPYLKGLKEMNFTAFFDTLSFFVTLNVMKILRSPSFYQKFHKCCNDLLSYINHLISQLDLPIGIRSYHSFFQFIFPDQATSSLFYKESINYGLIFYPEDNQCFSAAFEETTVMPFLKERFTSFFTNLKQHEEFSFKRESSPEWIIKTAWNVMDGCPPLNMPFEERMLILKSIMETNK